MLPTKANVQKAIHVRFKGATLLELTGSKEEGWAATFAAPEGREWAEGITTKTYRALPNVKKQDLWSECFFYIKSLHDLVPLPEPEPEPVAPPVDNTPEETKLDVEHPDFRLPTGEELEDAVKYMGLKYEKFCAMFDIKSRALRDWRKNKTTVPYAVWRLILIYSGKVKI